jgi:hypothetical protein
MSAKHSPVGRPIVSLLLIVVCLGIGPAVRPVRAQSLADVAKKEEARRKTIPEAAKVYTNKDLNAQPSGPPPPADAKAGDAAKDTGAKDAKDSKDAADVKDKQSVKDKPYWSGRMKKLQEQVDRDEGYVLAVQTRVNSLTADFVNRDDPAQRVLIERDRQKSIAELSRLTKAIADGKKSIADLEEEARRAGVPPGWLR